jgi:hypothetical protein
MAGKRQHAMVAKIVAGNGVRDARDGNVECFHGSPQVEATYTIDSSGCGERGR